MLLGLTYGLRLSSSLWHLMGFISFSLIKCDLPLPGCEQLGSTVLERPRPPIVSSPLVETSFTKPAFCACACGGGEAGCDGGGGDIFLGGT